jgi:hypothetical protein
LKRITPVSPASFCAAVILAEAGLDSANESNKNKVIFLIIDGVYKILISCYTVVGFTNAQGLVALRIFVGSLGNKLA